MRIKPYIVKGLVTFVVFALTIVFANLAFASPNSITFQSRIVKPDGLPLEATSVTFRMNITDTVGSCVIYQEDFVNRNMSGSKGLINLSLGSGAKVFPAGAMAMTDVFNNYGSPTLNCLSGGSINAGVTDRRKLFVQFNDGSGWQTVPAMDINSSPFALQAVSAMKLGGYDAIEYLRTANLPTCNPATQALTFNGTSITCAGIAGGGGTVTNVTSGNSDIAVATGTSIPVLTLNSTVVGAADKIVKLDASGNFGAINAAALTSLNASNLASGSVPAARMPALTGDVTMTAGSTTTAIAAGVIVDADVNAAAAIARSKIASGSINQVLVNDGSGVMSSLGCTNGEIIKWAGGVPTCSMDSTGTGTVTSVNSGNGDITVATTTTNPVVTLNAGTGANQIVKLNGTAQLPAVSGVNLTNLNATNLASGTVPAAQMPALTGDVTTGVGTTATTLANSGVTAGNDYTKFNVDAKGRVISASQISSTDVTAALTYTPLNKAGDSMTGALGLYQTAADPSTAGWNTTQKGFTWFNTTTNSIKYWDGISIQILAVSGSGLTNFNGESGSVQTLAIGTAGTAPVFNSVSNTHTLNIPMAATTGTTAGLLSKADYDSFVAKQAALGFTPLNPANNLSDVSSAATSRTNLGLGTAAVLNVGTGNNNIVQLNASAQLPAVDGSLITGLTASQVPNLDAAKLTSGTLAGARMPALTGDVTMTAGTTTTAISALARSKLANGTNNHVLINDGSGVMSSEANLAVSRGGTGVGTFAANKIVGTNVTGTGLTSFSCANGEVIKFDVTGNAVCGSDTASMGAGTTNRIPKYTGANALGDSAITDDGNRITATRSMASIPNSVAAAAVNLNLSNTHTLNNVGGAAITITNPTNGGVYNIIVTDPASRAYTFTGCTASFYRPANAATTVSTRTIYGLMTVDNGGGGWDCYITWSSGFQ